MNSASDKATLEVACNNLFIYKNCPAIYRRLWLEVRRRRHDKLIYIWWQLDITSCPSRYWVGWRLLDFARTCNHNDHLRNDHAFNNPKTCSWIFGTRLNAWSVSFNNSKHLLHERFLHICRRHSVWVIECSRAGWTLLWRQIQRCCTIFDIEGVERSSLYLFVFFGCSSASGWISPGLGRHKNLSTVEATSLRTKEWYSWAGG